MAPKWYNLPASHEVTEYRTKWQIVAQVTEVSHEASHEVAEASHKASHKVAEHRTQKG